MPDKQIYLVTGALGCIGSWILYHLLEEGHQAISFDLGTSKHRLELLLDSNNQDKLIFLKGDLTRPEELEKAVLDHGITHIIHMAALQVPFCKADPIMGARVNVVGTINVFEAARKAGIQHLAYASSVAVYGAPHLYNDDILSSGALLHPNTLYGVYKQANEGTARIYWQDHGISSASLRPYTVYGVGRDQGMTSEPTKAMLAAARGKDYEINFSGRMQFQLASDVARYFIAASRGPLEGANIYNIGSPPTTVREVADIIMQIKPGSSIGVASNNLPFPAGFDGMAIRQAYPDIVETPLEEGIRQTINHFEMSIAE